jgi:hypothetical protein
MTGIIVAACITGIAIYCLMGLGAYWFFALLMNDEPYDPREAFRYFLSWPTILFK